MGRRLRLGGICRASLVALLTVVVLVSFTCAAGERRTRDPTPPAASPTGGSDVMSPAGVGPMLDAIVAPWLGRQASNGTMPDVLWENDDHGRSRGYDEAIVAAVLLDLGIRRGDRRLVDAALRAAAWEVDPDSRTNEAPNPSVFETYFMATAFRAASRAGLLAERPQLAERWRAWLAARRPILLQSGRPYSNQLVVEAAGYAELLATGIGSRTPGAILSQPGRAERDLARFERRASGVCRYYTRVGVAVFSDGPHNPPAYLALSAAFLARYVELSGERAPRTLRSCLRALALGLEAITAPDGDVAYVGRSQGQSWVLSVSAFVALRQAAAERHRAARIRLRALAQRTLARLESLHRGGGRLLLAPLIGRVDLTRLSFDSRRRELCGIDGYTGAGIYEALTALGLLWAEPLLPPAASRHLVRRGTVGRRLSRGPSTTVVMAKQDAWAVVRPHRRTRTTGAVVDLRYDAGLVRLKARAGRRWVDLLPLLPRTQLQRAVTLLPRRVARGHTLTPSSIAESLGSDRVVLRLRYSDGARAAMAIALTGRGASIDLRGPPNGRYLVGLLADGPVSRSRSVVRTVDARHGFHPAPERVRSWRRWFASAESPRLTRYDVVLRARDGRVSWSIRPPTGDTHPRDRHPPSRPGPLACRPDPNRPPWWSQLPR